MLRSNVDHVRSRCESTARLESLENASTGNISYWTSMIYNNLDGYHELFQPTVQYSTNRIAAVDGTCIAIAIKNKYGVSQGGATISSIIDVNTKQFIDYKVSYSLNENNTLVQQMSKFNRSDLLIGDRNYGNNKLMTQIYDKVGFLFRIKSSSLMYKHFIGYDENSTIIDLDGKRLKLIKYKVDRKTLKLVKASMLSNHSNEDDDLSTFVLCTNDIGRTETELINLYRQRWRIVIAS